MERERVTFTGLKKRVSWGSIFAGVFTVLAISVLFSILSTSISLFMLDPTSDSPVSGIGTNMGIWTVVSLIISLAAGGFVAGKLAGADGVIHGFLVWATSMIVAVVFMAMLAIGAVRMTANILGSVTSVAGSVISGVGSAVGSGVSELADQAQNIFGDIDLSSESDRKEIRQDIRQALRKSGVRELQPEYIQRELRGVKNDLSKSVKQILTNPKNAENTIDKFLTKLQTRTEKFTENVDRDDLTRAIANNTSLSKAEVDKAVDEYIDIANSAIEQGREQMQNLQQRIEEARQEWQSMMEQAKVEADKAASAAGRAALWSFFAMLIGAAIAAFAGLFGTRKTQEGYEV